MQKEKLQVHSQFTCFKITSKSIEQIQPILRRALENASKIVATDEASFYGNDITSSQRMSNSGYISDIYIVKFDKSNSENIFKTLMSSFDDVTCLIAWELYDNNTLLLSCNHAHKFINVNKNLINEDEANYFDEITDECSDKTLIMKKSVEQNFQNHTSFDIYEDTAKLITPYLEKALKLGNSITVSESSPFKELTIKPVTINFGDFKEKHFEFEYVEKNIDFISNILTDSFNIEKDLDLFIWSIYENDALLISVNIIGGFANIRNDLLN